MRSEKIWKEVNETAATRRGQHVPKSSHRGRPSHRTRSAGCLIDTICYGIEPAIAALQLGRSLPGVIRAVIIQPKTQRKRTGPLTVYRNLDEWREVVSVFYDLEVVGDPDRFASTVDFTRHNDLILSNASFSALLFDHDPAAIRGVDHNFLLFERYHKGRGRGLVGDMSTFVDANRIQIVDMSRRYRTMTSDVSTQGVLIPHSAVGYDPSKHAPYLSARLDSEAGILLDLAHGAACEASAADNPATGWLLSSFCAILRAYITQQVTEEAAFDYARTRVDLVKTYVKRNLARADLSADAICRDLKISRTTLYRLFEDESGIATYITNCRIDHCFADLAGAPKQRGQIRRVAESWGFYDPANFKRRFRERFSVPPSACVGSRTSARDLSTQTVNHPVHGWMLAAPAGARCD